MENQNLSGVGPQDNQQPNHEAVDASPQGDTLLAGKFKSRDDAISSASELYQQLEGKEMPASEVLRLAGLDDTQLASTYQTLERTYHTRRAESVPSVDGEGNDVEKYIDDLLQKKGYVRRDELELERYEERELNSYFAQNPEAKQREDLIRKLASTEDYKDKSFADVDKDLQKYFAQPGAKATTEVPRPQSGNVAQESYTTDVSDDEFAQAIGASGNKSRSRISRK